MLMRGMIAREQKFQECLRNLFVPDAWGEVARAQKPRVQGTCEWILARSEYRDWLEGDASKLLQIVGCPGTGKTTMFWFLIENLESRTKDDSFARSTTLIYHACHIGPPVETVRGLLFQLLTDKPQTFKFIEQHFDTQRTNHFGDFWTLWKILCHIVEDPGLGKVFFVLDGLDECQGGGLFFSALRDLFLRLESSGNATVKLLVTYRPSTDAESVLKDVGRHLRFNVTIKNDMSRFIDWKLEDLSKHGHLPVDLKSRLRHFLSSNTNNFLLVSIILNKVSGLPAYSVEKELDRIPRNLHEAFTRILENNNFEGDHHSLSALKWIVCTQRPLKLNELAMALTLTWDERETGTTPPPHVVKELDNFLVSYRLMIHVDTVGKTVKVPHINVAKFFLENSEPKYSISYDATNLHILETCLTYLNREEFKSTSTCVHRGIEDSRPFNWKAALQEHLLAHPFLEYAALQWPAHAQAAGSKLATREWEYDFFGENTESLNAWVQIYWAFKRPFDDPPGFTALHVAGLLGLDPLLNWVVEKSQPTVVFDIDTRDTMGSTALHWAARNGHIGTVRILIDRGAVIDVTDNAGRTPLAAAATNGHDMIIELLLARGASINFPKNSRATPVHLAARNGKATVLRLFGAVSGESLDVYENDGRTPLSWAAMHGHSLAVKTLLELGAKFDSVDREYGRTPLHWVVVGGCEATRRQSLIDDGVDVQLDFDDEGQDHLYLDSQGYLDVVHSLYEAGADLNARDKAQSTPLHYATEMQHQDLQSLLIKLGADINLRNAQNKSSAQLAWDRKRLDWSLYEEDEELTGNLSEAGNSEVAVLRSINYSPDGPEVILTHTLSS